MASHVLRAISFNIPSVTPNVADEILYYDSGWESFDCVIYLRYVIHTPKPGGAQQYLSQISLFFQILYQRGGTLKLYTLRY